MRLGIGGRLLGAHLLLSLVLIAALRVGLGPALRAQLEGQHEQRLELAANLLAAKLAAGVAPRAAASELASRSGFRASVFDAEGRIVADTAMTPSLLSLPHESDRAELAEARHGRTGRARRVSRTTGVATRYVAVPVGDGRLARAAQTEAALEEGLSVVERATMLAAALGLLLAGALGFVASKLAERTFAGLTTTARRMAEGNLAARVPMEGPAEFVAIGASLNRLAEQLATQLGRLTTERDLLDAVLAAMEEAVLVLRPDGSLLLANPAARFLLSIPRAAQGQPLVETVRFPSVLDAARRAAGGEAASLELILSGPPRRELVGRAAPLPRGSEAAVVVVLRDVTDLRRLEGVRREFVANASHELRTPVAAIRGYAETLAAGALDDRPAAERFVAGLSRQAERLSALIDDLLDLSRIESGGLKFAPETVPVADALRRLADASAERARRKGLALEVAPVEAGLKVRADPRAIDMVLGNLLDNAVKYTPEGGRITLSAAPSERMIRIEVADTGPGIEPQHQARIFERFYRVDPGRSREVGGTGLGLAIAKHVAQQSGGDVGVESTPGAGSRFWVRLPPG